MKTPAKDPSHSPEGFQEIHDRVQHPIPAAPQPPLTFNDVMSAFAALQSSHEPPLQKAALPIAVAIVIGLLGWVGTTLGTLNTTVATMQPTLAIIQKSVDDLSSNQKATQDKIADMQTRLGQDDMRLDEIERKSGSRGQSGQ